MSCIKKIQIDDVIYTANVDFRNAIECDRIAKDTTIGDYERSLGIICTIFGGEGLENPEHYVKLLNWIMKYLSLGKEIENNNEKPDMDFIEDMSYIEASFMSDYNIWLPDIEMEWEKFITLMEGLSNSEMGNCCVLNRIRNLRNFDLKDITDTKEREKIIKAKNAVALKRYKKENNLTKEQEESMAELNKIIGI